MEAETDRVALRPIAEGLFTDDAQPRLVGGRHRASGRIVFPCPAGDEAADYEPWPLSRRGTVWSHTVQRFRPKSPPYAGPETFVPFVMAYVELPELIVASRLAGVAPEDVKIGMAVELLLIPFDQANGESVLIHAFQPVRKGAAS